MDDILYGGCSCHMGNPPCAFCTDTFECDKCGQRVLAEDQESDGAYDLICDECWNPEPAQDPGEDLMNTIRQASGGSRK